MIIKAKPLKDKYLILGGRIFAWFFKRRFNRVKINQVKLLEGHSYLVMLNHFSFLDGLFACYLGYDALYKQNPNLTGFYIMMLEKQLAQRKWLTRIGGFSIAPGTISLAESLDYTASLLDQPGNVVIMFPQGNLESQHVRTIEIKPGIAEIMKRLKGKCQLIWSSNLIDYFESLKPSVYFHMLDCGTNQDFNHDDLVKKINEHHLKSIKKHIRFTKEE